MAGKVGASLQRMVVKGPSVFIMKFDNFHHSVEPSSVMIGQFLVTKINRAL